MGRNVPYTHGMRNERATVPPSAEERHGVERFEKEAQEDSDFWAYVREVAKAAGLAK